MYSTTELYSDIEALDLDDDQAVVEFTLRLWRDIHHDEKKIFGKDKDIGAEDEMPILLALHAFNLSSLSEEHGREKLFTIQSKLDQLAIRIQDDMRRYEKLVPQELRKRQGNQVAEPFGIGFSKIFNLLQASNVLAQELSENKKIKDYENDAEVGFYVKRMQAEKNLKSQEAFLYFRDLLSKKAVEKIGDRALDMYEEATRITANNPTKQNIRMHEQMFVYGNKPNPQLQNTLDNLRNYLDNPTPQNFGKLENEINQQSKQQKKTSKKFINEYLKAHQTPQNAVAARKVKSITKSELVRAKHFVQKKLFGVGKEVIKEPSYGNKPLPNSQFTAVQTQSVLKEIYDKYATSEYNYDSKNGQIYREADKRFLKDLLAMPTLEKALNRVEFIQSSKINMHQLGYDDIALPLDDIQAILAAPLQHAQSLNQTTPIASKYQELPLRPVSNSSIPSKTSSDVTKSTPSTSRQAPLVISTYAQTSTQPNEGQYAELPFLPVSNEVVEKFDEFDRILESAMTVINHAKLPPTLRQTDFKNAVQHYHGSSTRTDQFSENFNFNFRTHEYDLAARQLSTLKRDLKDALEFALTKPTEAEATKYLTAVVDRLAKSMPEGMMTGFQQEITTTLQKDAPSARVNPSKKP